MKFKCTAVLGNCKDYEARKLIISYPTMVKGIWPEPSESTGSRGGGGGMTTCMASDMRSLSGIMSDDTRHHVSNKSRYYVLNLLLSLRRSSTYTSTHLRATTTSIIHAKHRYEAEKPARGTCCICCLTQRL